MTKINSITIITSPFACTPPNAYGAIERRWYNVAACWRNQGYKVQLISKNPETERDLISNDDFKYIKGYLRSGNVYKDIFWDFFYSIKAMRAATQSDVIILNTFWSPILYPVFRKKFRMSMYNVARFPKNHMWLYNMVDCLSCVSSSVLDALIDQTPQLKPKATYVNNPINTSIFKTDKTHAFPIDKVRVVYSGRVHKEKGLDILVKTINLLKRSYEIELSIVGPRDIGHGGSGLKYVEELNNLADGWSINWIDPTSNSEELAEILKSNDVFCYPSLADKGETFGVAPLEAMGLGLVTIVSDLGCFKDFIEDGVSGIVFNHRVKKPEEELLKAFVMILSNRSLYEKLSFGAIETGKRFSVEYIAGQYIDVFNKILHKKSL